MNKHSELIERLKEDIDYLINREGFSELPNLTVDNIRQAITALSHEPVQSQAIDRMARAAAKDSLPTNGMYNREQLDCMFSERISNYRELAEIMLNALLKGE